MGAKDLPIHELEGQHLIVDGFYGDVVVRPSANLELSYRELVSQEREFSAVSYTHLTLPTILLV